MTTRLSPAAYAEQLARESARFREVLTGVDAAAKVPTCPGWTATDLAYHLTEVQWFWAQILARRPHGPAGVTGEGGAPVLDELVEPDRAATYDAQLAAFDEASADLHAQVASAPPEAEAWSWAEQTVGFTQRRQAHEALIHRLDAEAAARMAWAPIDPALAADGVDEVLTLFYGLRPPWATFTPDERIVLVECTDVPHSWWVELGRVAGTAPDGTQLEDEALRVLDADAPRPAHPTATISGTAEHLDAWLWHRGRAAFHVTGNETAYDAFVAAISRDLD